MRRFLQVFLVMAACTPLILVATLFAAARFPWMDRMTLEAPTGVQKAVAAVAMNSAGYGKQGEAQVVRVLRLDPENADAWSRSCSVADGKNAKIALEYCGKALKLEYSVQNLVGQGLAQERLQDFCAAEDSFTGANSLVNARYTYILRDLGRAALKCGHSGASVASFEVAEDKDAKEVEDEDDADTLKLDREWLVIANVANKDPKRAAAACSKAHPDWKNCDCKADGKEAMCRNVP